MESAENKRLFSHFSVRQTAISTTDILELSVRVSHWGYQVSRSLTRVHKTLTYQEGRTVVFLLLLQNEFPQ